MLDIAKLKALQHEDCSHEWRVYLAAQEYIKAKIFVIPLRKNSKAALPAAEGINLNSASRSNKVIDRWFHPGTGKYAGFNIGLATGRTGGIFALDIDTAKNKDDVDGFDALEKLTAEYGDLPPCPIQTTPSGGAHYIFQWQESAESSTSKIAKNIDTRGGKEMMCKGHVVAFPSVVDGRTYTWDGSPDIPEIPAWIRDKLGVPWKERVEVEASGPFEFEVKMPIEQIARMLEYINIDDLSYEEWLAVGQAINSQAPGQDGLDLWDDWSKNGERYKPTECLSRWGGFDPDGGVRVGTLQYMARKGGWVPGPEDLEAAPYEEEVARMNETFAMINVGDKLRILREIPNPADPMYPRYKFMEKDAFRSIMANKTIAITVLGANGNPKTAIKSIGDIWLAHPSRRTYELGLIFSPGKEEAGYYNTWRGFTVEPSSKGDCQMYLDHIRDVICRGNQEWYEWLIDWMADVIQDPANPKGCAVGIKGIEGTGKGTMMEWFGELFGPHYSHLIDTSHLTSNFTAHLNEALIIFVDEAIWGGDHRAAGKVKGLITEKNIITERKGIDAELSKNYSRVVVASNEDWFVPAGPLSRRFFILEASSHRRDDFEYFAELKRLKENGGLGALLKFLMDREITNNLYNAPATKYVEQQRQKSMRLKSPHEWWSRILIAGEHNIRTTDEIDEDAQQRNPRWPRVLDRIAVFEDYEAWALHRNMFVESPIVLYRTLKELGLKVVRPESGGTRRYKFEVPPRKKCEELYFKATGVKVDDEES